MRARAKRVLSSREAASFSLLSAFKSFKKKAIAVGPFSSTKRAFKSYAETCASLLRRCTAIPDLHGPLGLALHAQAIRSGISADSSVSTKLLTMYSAWGCLADRDRIFSEAFHAFDLFSFNFMISAYCRSGHLNAARDLFDRMPERNAVTWTAMLDGLMKHGCVSDAVELYKRNPFRTVISSTAMISGFVHNELYYEALITSRSMLASGLMPNEVTFTCVIKACIGGGEFGLAESVLGLIVKTNFEQHLSVRNSLITLFLRMDNVRLARRVFDEMEEKDVVSWTAILDTYAEMGDLKEAHWILDEMPKRNEVSWSTMIARYDQNGDASEAIRMFALMLSDGCRPNISCFSSVLSASANLKYMLFGARIHCHALKVGFDSNVFVASSLVNMYSKCGKSDDAHLVFDLLPEKNIVSWNSMQHSAISIQDIPRPASVNHTRGVGDSDKEQLPSSPRVVSPHKPLVKSTTMPATRFRDDVDIIADYLKEATTCRPSILIVCGSGLGGLSKCLSNTTTINYSDIPRFPKSTVAGHAGELVFGEIDGLEVVCMRGRFHTYEGHDVNATTLPIRVMCLLGVKFLVVTNAAGGLNPDYNVGDLMIIGDHLNMPGLAGKHPLVGPNDDRFGERFTPMSDCYDVKLQNLAWRIAKQHGISHKVRRHGVYCFVSGPTYETPTESKLLRLVGGDSVGMSTVPEVVVARHCGMHIIGLSLITNMVVMPGQQRTSVPASHQEVLDAVASTQAVIEHYVRDLIVAIGKDYNDSTLLFDDDC